MGRPQYVHVELYRTVTDIVTRKRWVREVQSGDPTLSAVYSRTPVTISHGRGPEQGEPTPSTASLTFASHDYNPENPASPLYGAIGLNTPIRIQAGDRPPVVDDFGRTLSGQWGGPWITTGGAAADYDVNGSEATQTHPVANELHASYVDTGSTDHRVRAVWDWSADDITGAPLVVTVRGRATDGGNYYALNVEYSTDEQLTIALVKRVGGIGALLKVSSVTINLFGLATADMMGELYVEGNRIYGSAWRRLADFDEPLVWQLEAEDDDLTTGTLAGWGSLRASGNTNVDVQGRLRHFEALPGTLRFAGEVADWRPRRDRRPNGDRWVEVDAGDPLLRLQTPQADVLRSALSREIERSTPIAYWRIDDGEDALYAASALPGGTPMAIRALVWETSEEAAVDWSPVEYVPWLEPMSTPAVGLKLVAIGDVPMSSSATAWTVDFTFRIAPDYDPIEGGVAFQVTGAGVVGDDTNPRVDYQLIFEQGTCTLIYWSRGAATDLQFLIDGVPIDVFNGRIYHARLKVAQDGSNVDWEVLVNNATLDSGTIAGGDWDTLASLGAVYGSNSVNGFHGTVAVSHYAVWDHLDAPPNAAAAAVVGRSGELVGDRLVRLFAEEGIAFELVGDAADTEPAGPQLLDTLAANAAACEAVDMGLLYGSRHQVGVSYRTRVSLYNQTPLVLDVDGGDLVPPLEPVIGALGVVNDVTVRRDRGSSASSIAETGPLNVNPPHIDPQGVGRYPVEYTLLADVDEQLQGLADWRRYRGTVKAVRYPQVSVSVGALVSAGKAALAAAVDRLRIGDRVDLDNAEPTGVAQLVPGYTETLGAGAAVERVLTLAGTPAQVYEVGVYDAAGHRYDSAYSSTAAPFTAGTDTSLSVAVEAGRVLWVTGSGSPQFPIDIAVAGCRLRVTAIAGVTSPQTFTVDTAVVNGITKAIPAGTPVRLWAPRRYGL